MDDDIDVARGKRTRVRTNVDRVHMNQARAKPVVPLDRGVELSVKQVIAGPTGDVKDASPTLPPLMPKGGDV